MYHLYTQNIPHKGALHFLETNPDGYKYPEQPNPDILGKVMNLVIKQYVWIWREILGTATGTKMAPAYANLD